MANKINVLNIEKFKGQTYCIELEDEENLYVHSSIISEFNLKADMQLPQSAIDEIKFANDFRKAKERALYLFDNRDYSEKELYGKLKRNYSEEICQAVIEKMIDIGLIDDEKYAQKYARYLFETKKMGKFRAKAEMLKKGLDNEVVDKLLEEYSYDTFERIREFVGRRYSKYLNDEKGRKKVFNALIRNGYSYSDARDVLKHFMEKEEFDVD